MKPNFVILLGFFLYFAAKIKAEEDYRCPPGWDYGSACGSKNCYRIVSIPPANKARAIDDNFCAEFDKEAMPASIKCEEENSMIPTLPKYNYLFQKTVVGIGIYVPANIPSGRNNFVNRDGTKVEYTKWGPGGGSGKAARFISVARPHGDEYSWQEISPTALRHLLCKRPAILQPPKTLAPAVIKNDTKSDGEYVCPAGFDLGNVCGGHFCYRTVSLSPGQRERMIDNNFCGQFDKDAIPAIIRCKEENEFIATLSDNAIIAETYGFALGLHIPATKPFHQNAFINFDGSLIEYLNWGISVTDDGPFKDPNGFLKGPERVVFVRRYREGNGYINTWHDMREKEVPHLLCKTSAKFKPSLLTATIHKDEYANYSCPQDWILGNVCGGHHCYKIVSVPENKKARVIDDNYCGEIDNRSIPAIIRCEEENEFLSTPPFAPTALQSGFALGLYIPAKTAWSPNGFVNYDGTKVEYAKWGILSDYKPPIKEPNSWLYHYQEKNVVYLMQKNGNGYRKGWHDFHSSKVTKVLCKMPAAGAGVKTKPPPPQQQQHDPPMLTLAPEPLPTNQPSRKSCIV